MISIILETVFLFCFPHWKSRKSTNLGHGFILLCNKNWWFLKITHNQFVLNWVIVRLMKILCNFCFIFYILCIFLLLSKRSGFENLDIVCDSVDCIQKRKHHVSHCEVFSFIGTQNICKMAFLHRDQDLRIPKYSWRFSNSAPIMALTYSPKWVPWEYWLCKDAPFYVRGIFSRI